MEYIYFGTLLIIQFSLLFFFLSYLQKMRTAEQNPIPALRGVLLSARYLFFRLSGYIFALSVPLLILFALLSQGFSYGKTAYILFFVGGSVAAFLTSWLSIIAYSSSVKSLVLRGDYHSIRGIRDTHILNGTRTLLILNLLIIFLALITTFMYEQQHRLTLLLYGAGFTFYTGLFRAFHSQLALSLPRALQITSEREAAIPTGDFRNPTVSNNLAAKILSEGATEFLDLADSLHIIFLLTFFYGTMSGLILFAMPVAILASAATMGYLYSARLISRELLTRRIFRAKILSYALTAAIPLLVSFQYEEVYPLVFLAGFLMRELVFREQMHKIRLASREVSKLASAAREGFAALFFRGITYASYSTLVFLLPGIAILLIASLSEIRHETVVLFLLGFTLPPIFFYTFHSLHATLNFVQKFEKLNQSGKSNSIEDNLFFAHDIEGDSPVRVQMISFLIGMGVTTLILGDAEFLEWSTFPWAASILFVFAMIPLLPFQFNMSLRSARLIAENIHSQFQNSPSLLTGETTPDTKQPDRIGSFYATISMASFGIALFTVVLAEYFFRGSSSMLLLTSLLLFQPASYLLMHAAFIQQKRSEMAHASDSRENSKGKRNTERAVEIFLPLRDGLAASAGAITKWLALLLLASFYISR